VPLFTSGGLGLVILVLVLRIWSCLHHCKWQENIVRSNILEQYRVDNSTWWHRSETQVKPMQLVSHGMMQTNHCHTGGCSWQVKLCTVLFLLDMHAILRFQRFHGDLSNAVYLKCCIRWTEQHKLIQTRSGHKTSVLISPKSGSVDLIRSSPTAKEYTRFLFLRSWT